MAYISCTHSSYRASAGCLRIVSLSACLAFSLRLTMRLVLALLLLVAVALAQTTTSTTTTYPPPGAWGSYLCLPRQVPPCPLPNN